MEKNFRNRAALSVAVSAGLFGLGRGVADAANSPIALTAGSYNYNTVVSAGTPGSSAIVVGGTPAAVDTENGITYWASTYNTSGALPTAGTPFTSSANSATQFQFQPYTGNNTLLINADQKYSGGTSPAFAPPYTQTGTLTLATAAAYTSLAVLYTAAGQNYYGTIPSIDYTLNFSDGTSYNNSGAASFAGQSWSNSQNVATYGYRAWVNPNVNYGQTSGSSWYMHEADITIPSADASKALTSISFFDSGSGYYNSPNSNNGGDPNSLAIYALSGSASTVIPPMTYQGNATGHQGIWDMTSLNFLNTSVAPPTPVAYEDGANVTFTDSATGPTAVTIASTVSPGSVTFTNNTKNYSFSGAGIAGQGGVTLTGTGSVTLNNSNTYIGATNISSGTLVIGAGGSVASSSVLTGASATLSLTGGGALTSTSLNLTGAGTVSVTSPSTLSVFGGTFMGTMTGTGAVAFDAGTFQVGSQAAFNLSGGITIGSTTTTGTLLIADTTDTSAGIVGGTPKTATLYGSGTGGLGALRGADGATTTWAGNVAIGSTGATLSGGAGGTLNVTGVISGASSSPVVFGGDTNSTIVLSGSNTYTGQTQVGSTNGSVSTLKLGVANTINPASGLAFAGSGTLDLNGNSPTFSSLTGSSGTITNSSSTLSKLTIPQPTGVSTFGGTINDGVGKVGMAFTGPGNQILSGSSTYSGGTSIPTGTVTTASNTALGTGTVTLGGGTLALGYSGAGGTAINGLSLSTFQVNRANYSGAAETISNGTLTLTDVPTSDSSHGQTTSAFTQTPQALNLTTGFVAKFTYQATQDSNPEMADGMAFVLQNDPNGASALGAGANDLGYSGIQNSVAVALNIYDQNGGPGLGLFTGGVQIYGPWIATSPVVVSSSDTSASNFNPNPINFVIAYSGSTQILTETLTDPIAGTTFTTSYTGVDLASDIGGSSAYVGFTGATGYNNAGQNVSNFSLVNTINGPTSLSNNVVATANTSSVIQLSVSSGALAGTIGSLNIASGALVTLHANSLDGIATSGILTTTGLTLAGSTNSWTGKLDVANNSLDVQAGNLATIINQIKQGYNKGGWNGSGGIISSTAAADSTHLTALGVIVNNVGGSAIYGSGTTMGLFDGISPAPTDVLIKYTYYGDANLDGAVDGSDYTLIDAGFNSNGTLTGWYNGDFNYDGKIDGSDYTLIDNAFNTQGASLGSNPASLIATSTTQLAGSSAVPEPASLAVLGLGGVGLLGRRRRK